MQSPWAVQGSVQEPVHDRHWEILCARKQKMCLVCWEVNESKRLQGREQNWARAGELKMGNNKKQEEGWRQKLFHEERVRRNRFSERPDLCCTRETQDLHHCRALFLWPDRSWCSLFVIGKSPVCHFGNRGAYSAGTLDQKSMARTWDCKLNSFWPELKILCCRSENSDNGYSMNNIKVRFQQTSWDGGSAGIISLSLHSQELGCAACQVRYSLNTFSWTLTLCIWIGNRGGATCFKKKKFFFGLCGWGEAEGSYWHICCYGFWQKICRFTVLESVKYSDCLSSMNLPRNSVCCKTTVNSFKKPSSHQLGHVWNHTIFKDII